MPRIVPYTYYTQTYGGTAIEEADWGHLSQLASRHLDRTKVLCRVTPVGDEAECESNAICSMAEVMQRWEDATTGSGGVTSERIGSVSVSYESGTSAFPGGLGLALSNAMVPWLHVCRVARI